MATRNAGFLKQAKMKTPDKLTCQIMKKFDLPGMAHVRC
jgi:hypothetical protein